ncbi:hypothetical protein AJ87_08870 [Rhizobium yanglingense]|nr:hypothetical protein AJ87_08870 [Rhizobium yanglingense]
MADLVGAIRLPKAAFRAHAGTAVVADILFLRKPRPDEPAGNDSWLALADVLEQQEGEGSICVNRWFADHPEMVLGRHAVTSGPFGELCTSLPCEGDQEGALGSAIGKLPTGIYDGEPEVVDLGQGVTPARYGRTP